MQCLVFVGPLGDGSELGVVGRFGKPSCKGIACSGWICKGDGVGFNRVCAWVLVAVCPSIQFIGDGICVRTPLGKEILIAGGSLQNCGLHSIECRFSIPS
ncbi:hypothetical protein SDC9_153263 [bioreactor metagenome]|uniref:Uncharacterized protein n=1 Tax=bioreactor metagenome TaxID=1076179 RepID=A0A645EXW2_9ZZZZ